MPSLLARVVAPVVLVSLAVPALAQERALGVSPQGMILRAGGPDTQTSPGGRYRLRKTALEGDFVRVTWRVDVESLAGARATLSPVAASALLLSDVGRLVTIEATHSHVVPTRVTVLDLAGETLFTRDVPALTDPHLSPDGAWLAYRSRDGVELVDLSTLEVSRFGPFDRFAAGPGGVLAGVPRGDRRRLVLVDRRGGRVERPLPGGARRIAFTPDGAEALVMTATRLSRVPFAPGPSRPLYQAPRGAELRDLLVTPSGVHLGERRRDEDRSAGRLVTVGAPAGAPTIEATATGLAASKAPLPGKLPWPLLPSAQHPVGNTYGEYQQYGGSAYLHPGIDVLGADLQPVFAVKGGVVRAVLTTSGQYHWRVAIADEAGSGTSDGYLYAHLDLPSITVNVGQTVAKGEYLGDLVPWPVAGFTHTHFARIRDTGAQWSGSWLCTDNPHLDLEKQSEFSAPVFQDSVPSGRFAFCTDNTSVYQSPLSLVGKVDIIARVGDTVASGWVCAVQSLRYTIHPLGSPQAPIVDDRLAVNFDMALDTYQGGPIDPLLVGLLYKSDSTCDTQGDYSNRRFFHILTNSNGDEVYDASDLAGSWDTSTISDGNYVVEVTATDARGNATTASMVVRTANGNP